MAKRKTKRRTFRILCIEMLSDVDGMISSKRVITLLAFFCTFCGFFANLFFGVAVASYIFEGMLMLTGAGLGFTLAEHYSGKDQLDIPENMPDETDAKSAKPKISFTDDSV